MGERGAYGKGTMTRHKKARRVDAHFGVNFSYTVNVKWSVSIPKTCLESKKREARRDVWGGLL